MDRYQIIEDLKDYVRSDPHESGLLYLNEILNKIDELEEYYE